MDEDVTSRRPKRRCVQRKTVLPSAVHYVGYVEDEETPDMIMRKFEEMERVMARVAAPSAANTSSDPQPSQDPQVSASAAAIGAPGHPGQSTTGLGDTAVQAYPPVLHPGPLPSESQAAGSTREPSDPSYMTYSNSGAGMEPGASAGVASGADEPCERPSSSQISCGPGTSGQQHQGQQQPEGMHDEQLLLEVFKRTSYFNVRSIVQAGDAPASSRHGAMADETYDWGTGAWDGALSDEDSDLDMRLGFGSELGFWSADDLQDSDEGSRESERGGRASSSGGGATGRTGSGGGVSAARHGKAEKGEGRPVASARERNMKQQVLLQYNRDTNALIRRRVRPTAQRGDSGLTELRIPPAPIPAAWGRTVQPYEPPEVLAATLAACLRLSPAPSGASNAGLPASNRRRAGAAEGHAGGGTGPSGPATGVASTPAGLTQSVVAQASNPSLHQAVNPAPNPDMVSDPGTSYWEVADVAQACSSRPLQRAYQAVMINCGWEPAGGGQQDITEARLISRLRALPLTRLCPSGFVFAWAKKQHLHPITKQLHAWGYTYVENLTWVWLNPNNTIVCEPSPYAKRSHITLLIFRREGEGKDIELKHQRNPDVVFDCIAAAEAAEWEVPCEVYNIIETMLPTGKGQFLELWASRSALRKGWTRVTEVEGL